MDHWIDEEAKQRVMSNLIKRFEESDEYRHRDPRLIHISELVYCLREAALHRVCPEPMTPKKVGYFLAGRAYHGLLEGLDGAEHHETETLGERQGVKVIGTIDSLDDVVTEIKSNRGGKNVPPHYMKQLFYYQALRQNNNGRLFIFRTGMRYVDDPLDSWRFRMTDDELKGWEDNLWRNAIPYSDVLVKLVEHRVKNCEDLDAVLPRPDSDMEWKCSQCYYPKPIRGGG